MQTILTTARLRLREMHAGDLAHGEALDLDDSTWPIVRAKAEAGTDAVWYRRIITVPTTLNELFKQQLRWRRSIVRDLFSR